MCDSEELACGGGQEVIRGIEPPQQVIDQFATSIRIALHIQCPRHGQADMASQHLRFIAICDGAANHLPVLLEANLGLEALGDQPLVKPL